MTELSKIARHARDQRMGHKAARNCGKTIPHLQVIEDIYLLIERLAKQLDKPA